MTQTNPRRTIGAYMEENRMASMNYLVKDQDSFMRTLPDHIGPGSSADRHWKDEFWHTSTAISIVRNLAHILHTDMR